MPIVTLGLNHLTAPVGLREKVAIAPAATAAALRDLAAEDGIEEALILSTCNRTELSCNVRRGAEQQPRRWLHRRHHLPAGRLDDYLYRYEDAAAVRHLFRVATGLDSMVLGEPQILGQVKQAWQAARAARTLATPLDRLMQHAFTVAKRVRSQTRIGAQTVSVAFTAVRLAERVFADLGDACVLLIGAGDTMELVARHLTEKKVRRLIIANRSLGHAQALAARHGAFAIALDAVSQHLAEADIVVASTAAPEPVLDAATVRAAIRARRRKPMFLVDIAVPRDIDPAVRRLEDVFLYDIDDLRGVIDEHLRSRRQAAEEAEAIITLQVERYMAWRRSRALRNPVVALRRDAERQRDEVLGKARALLGKGREPGEVLEYLADTLTNKLLHAPSASLHAAALAGDRELLRSAERLYDLDAEHDADDHG